MIKNDLNVAKSMAEKLSNSCSMNPKIEATIEYSSSNAVSSLEMCIAEVQKIVDLMASNMKVDSINIMKIGLALDEAEQATQKVISNE